MAETREEEGGGVAVADESEVPDDAAAVDVTMLRPEDFTSPTLRRLAEEVKREQYDYLGYNRMHNRHNRSR